MQIEHFLSKLLAQTRKKHFRVQITKDADFLCGRWVSLLLMLNVKQKSCKYYFTAFVLNRVKIWTQRCKLAANVLKPV